MIAKRIFDLVLTAPALVILSPLLAALGLWIKYDSPGPVLFRQTRVGKSNIPFAVMKFRSMADRPHDPGAKLTVGEDLRITPSGRILRRFKLDELPQLFNVVLGEMSLVGPRPEVPEFVDHWSEQDRDIVLSVLPGLTDYAALEFIDEARLLSEADDPQKTYIEVITPQKIKLYKKYIAEQSLVTDIKLIARTILKIVKS